MALSLADSRVLLHRYPAVNAIEQAALIGWVRSLRPGKLVALLAEGPTERKLLELRANEPELVTDGRYLANAMFFAMATGAVAIVATAATLAVY